MNHAFQLQEIHDSVSQSIIDERSREAAALISEKRTAAALCQKRYAAAMNSLNAQGLNPTNIQYLEMKLRAQDETQLSELETLLNPFSGTPSPQDEIHMEETPRQDGACLLKPSWVASFSDDDLADNLAGADSISPQTLTPAENRINMSNWAKGSGSGLLGSGVGKIHSWVDFGFWFNPPTTKTYSIQPLFRLRGHIIAKANDGFYGSKYARVAISAWTTVHQCTWKKWNHENIYDMGDSNINVNRRIDVNRSTNNRFLLAEGEWAYIRCALGLSAYARGDDSHARNDFSTGGGNYLFVPHCWVK